MINSERLLTLLKELDVQFYCGVPDSLLRSFLSVLEKERDISHHVTANEGLAMALASGYHLQTGRLPLVYLQNSGLGNIINPLTSLADADMYGIPMLLLIGWRGKPGVPDEPQHKKMGRITPALLEALEMTVFTISADENIAFEQIRNAARQALQSSAPVVLLAVPGVFEEMQAGKENLKTEGMKRETVIECLMQKLTGDEIVICTTGKTGREFYELNLQMGSKFKKYFLSAGAMGHANHVALGISIGAGQKVIMLDGDGALLMHLGSMPLLAALGQKNFMHILLNNECHESVGGQPTAAHQADYCKIAAGCGYRNVVRLADQISLNEWCDSCLPGSGSFFAEILVNKESRPGLGRPAGLPSAWKKNFMQALMGKS